MLETRLLTMEKSVKLFTVELRDEAISLQRLSFRLQLCEGWNWVLYEWWRQVNCSTRCKNLSHHCHKLWLGAGKDSIYGLDFNFDHSCFINLYAKFSRSRIQAKIPQNWSELGSEKITGMTELQMWYESLIEKNIKNRSAVDYEYKLHLILFVYWIISSVGVMVQGMCTRSSKENNSAIK